jgi:hypothetical protein
MMALDNERMGIDVLLLRSQLVSLAAPRSLEFGQRPLKQTWKK